MDCYIIVEESRSGGRNDGRGKVLRSPLFAFGTSCLTRMKNFEKKNYTSHHPKRFRNNGRPVVGEYINNNKTNYYLYCNKIYARNPVRNAVRNKKNRTRSCVLYGEKRKKSRAFHISSCIKQWKKNITQEKEIIYYNTPYCNIIIYNKRNVAKIKKKNNTTQKTKTKRFFRNSIVNSRRRRVERPASIAHVTGRWWRERGRCRTCVTDAWRFAAPIGPPRKKKKCEFKRI